MAGIGSHAQEVLDAFIHSVLPNEDVFYNDVNFDKLRLHSCFKVLKTQWRYLKR